MTRLPLFTTLFALLLAGISAYGQQDVHYTQSMYNRVYFNPAAAGAQGKACVSAIHRSQWVGFEGAPSTQNVNFDMPLKKLNGGFGLSLLNDRLGFEQNNEVKASLSYGRIIGPGRLSAGISAGLAIKGIIDPDWETPDGSNPGNDPSIPVGGQRAIRPDVSVGFLYNVTNWYVGLSMSNTLEQRLDYSGGQGIQSERHYFVMAGYEYPLNRDLSLQPFLMLKTDASSFYQFDFSVRGMYDNKYWAGLAYRYQDAVSLLMGMRINENLKVGYAYDLGVSSLRKVHAGSHEIMLNYCFTIEKSSEGKQIQRYRNVRFL